MIIIIVISFIILLLIAVILSIRSVKAKDRKKERNGVCNFTHSKNEMKQDLDKSAHDEGHPGEYKCTFVGCTFVTKYISSLRRHMKVQHRQGLVSPGFGKRVVKNGLKRYEEAHSNGHTSTFGSYDFGWMLNSSMKAKDEDGNWNNHQQNEITEVDESEETSEFRCTFNECGYSSRWIWNLKRHIKAKHNQNTDEFEDEYSQLNYGYEHNGLSEDVSQDADDFKCNSCMYSTPYKSNLKRHVKSKHN